MANLVDTSPKAGFLRALQNQRWTVAGAISELVDNSFGEGRGNASSTLIEWNASTRTLTVLDNGQGMDALSRLFRLGDTVGRTVGDIGEYGAGGTMALVWLGRKVNVWTLRDAEVAHTSVQWEDQIRSGIFPQVDDGWYPATAGNTPTDLLELRQGTLVKLEFPQKRHVNVSNIQKELARTYGPALRQGRRLVWRTIGRGSRGEERELHDLVELGESRFFTIDFELEGSPLVASGLVGIVPGLTVSQSGIAVCFGPRLLKVTKDCFRSPDTGEVFAGIGVSGYVDLHDGWQPFLSTTKSAVDDDRAWDMLMHGLFRFLLPILEELERARRRVLFEDLALELKDIFNGRVLVRVDKDGKLQPDPDGQDKVGRLRSGEAAGASPATPAAHFDDAAVQLDLIDATDEELDGLLCRVDVEGHSLLGFINTEHPFVDAALRDSPPNRRALQKLVVDAVAARVMEYADLIPKMFPPAIVRRLDSLEEGSLRHGLLVRLLIDRVREDEPV